MLARKYYAQKGNSKGRMLTSDKSIGGTQSRLNKLHRQINTDNFKETPKKTASNHIKERRLAELSCSSGPTYVTKTNASCSCYLTKDVRQAKTQSEYIANELQKKCTVHKPMIDNIKC